MAQSGPDAFKSIVDSAPPTKIRVAKKDSGGLLGGLFSGILGGGEGGGSIVDTPA